MGRRLTTAFRRRAAVEFIRMPVHERATPVPGTGSCRKAKVDSLGKTASGPSVARQFTEGPHPVTLRPRVNRVRRRDFSQLRSFACVDCVRRSAETSAIAVNTFRTPSFRSFAIAVVSWDRLSLDRPDGEARMQRSSARRAAV